MCNRIVHNRVIKSGEGYVRSKEGRDSNFGVYTGEGHRSFLSTQILYQSGDL